jgi:hypothetical protein
MIFGLFDYDCTLVFNYNFVFSFNFNTIYSYFFCFNKHEIDKEIKIDLSKVVHLHNELGHVKIVCFNTFQQSTLLQARLTNFVVNEISITT